MLPLIWSKTLPCYWLYLRNILILDTCMAEVSYLGDTLRREHCFLLLTFKTCLQRQSQHHAKKEKTKQGNLTLLWLLHVSLVLTSLCPFAAFSVSRNNNLMQMVSAGEAVYCIVGTFAVNNFCRFFYENFAGDVWDSGLFWVLFVKKLGVLSLLTCIYYYIEGEEC